MNSLIYIKSLHRPYNQNLNSIKWVCKFIQHKNSNNEITKSEFYIEFYIYLIKKLYNQYKKTRVQSLAPGLPSNDTIKKSYQYIITTNHNNRKKIINNSLSKRENEIDRAIFSSYKASSYYINLAKDKLEFIDNNYSLNEKGKLLISLRSGDLKLSRKEKYVFFKAIIENDFHFFISLLLLKKIEKKINNLDIEKLHYDFLVDKYNIKHFNFTEASQLNFSTVRNYWINDLDVLDKNLNIRKVFLDIIINNGFENDFNEIKEQISLFYKENIIAKSKFQKTTELFFNVYKASNKNELGFVALQEIAKNMHLGKLTFQKFISEFYESEKNKFNIFFNNIVQSNSYNNQYFVRNRPVVNIRIKELN